VTAVLGGRPYNRWDRSSTEHEGKSTTVRSASNSRAANTHRRGFAIAVVAVTCAVVIAACGSSDPSQRGSAKGAVFTAALNYSKCMRTHGVPNYPDPKVTGNSVDLGGSGIDPQSPAFQSARQSCQHLLLRGGPGSAHPSAQDKAQMLHLTLCMRQHGVAGFPDPTLVPPPNPADYGTVIDRNDVVIAIPKSIDTSSPAFKQAATACNFNPAK
jgi:hypothetical protein